MQKIGCFRGDNFKNVRESNEIGDFASLLFQEYNTE